MKLRRGSTYISRIAAAVLLVALCLTAAGCKEEAELITGKNTRGGYSFSYPEDWSIKTDGLSTVITAGDVGGSVPYAIVRFTLRENVGGVTAKEFWEQSADDLTGAFEKLEITKKEGFDHNSGSAYDVRMSVTVKGHTNLYGQPEKDDGSADYTVRQLLFEEGRYICVATYMSEISHSPDYEGVCGNIRESFAYIAPEETGKTTVDGSDFSVPVPEGWKLDTAEAYYTLTKGKASVTVSVFSAEKNMAVESYWEEIYAPSIEASLDGYSLVRLLKNGEGADPVHLGGIAAVDAEYTAKSISGSEYRFRQRIAMYDGDVYSVVLTASEEDFAEAVEGYNRIVEGFLYK